MPSDPSGAVQWTPIMSEPAKVTTERTQQFPAQPRRRWRGLVIVLVLLVLAGLAGYAVRGTRVFWDKPEQVLVVDVEHLDFGEVWVRHDFHWTLPIRNTSSRDIRIASMITSCGCTSVEPESIVVPARSEVPVELSLDLRPSNSAPSAQLRRPFSVRVMARTDSPSTSSAQWRIEGVVRTPIAFSPSVVDFEQSLVEGMPFDARTVRVGCNEPVERLVVDCDPNLAVVDCTRLAESDSERFAIRVLPADDLPVGDHEFDVSVQAILADGTSTPTILLPVRARILDDIRVLPELSHLGVLEVGSEVEETLRLESRRGAAFSVESAKPDSDKVTIARLERVSPTAWVCMLRCRVASEGETSAPVRFAVRYESGGQSEVCAVVRWRGIGAE